MDVKSEFERIRQEDKQPKEPQMQENNDADVFTISYTHPFADPFRSSRMEVKAKYEEISTGELKAKVDAVIEEMANFAHKAAERLSSVPKLSPGNTKPAPAQTEGAPHPADTADTSRGANPSCEHGQMVWKEGVGKKSGKPYAGWFCLQSKCDPQWPGQ